MKPMREILRAQSHRPWPMPRGPWIMRMTWHDLLFAHWRVDEALLRPHIPAGLLLQAFDGSAWLGLVPFRMTGIRLRGLPPLPTTGRFAEINVRTYVSDGEKPGVWFISLDAHSRLAVAIARRWFRLNYVNARIKCSGGACLAYDSRRCGDVRADFVASYEPRGEVFHAKPGTLEHFLTERYCLYAGNRAGGVYRAEIHHEPWPLQRATMELRCNTMAAPLGVDLAGEPQSLLFTRRLDVAVWSPRRVERR